MILRSKDLYVLGDLCAVTVEKHLQIAQCLKLLVTIVWTSVTFFFGVTSCIMGKLSNYVRIMQR
jgi:hypothetical protein